MILDLAASFAMRFRPRQGWLLLIAAFSAVILFMLTLQQAFWVSAETRIVIAALGGFGLAAVLAQRRTHALLAWLLIGLYGLLLPLLQLGRLLPTAALLAQGWEPTRQFWLTQGTLLQTRLVADAALWLTNELPQDSGLLALLMSVGIWLLAALMAWSTFRWNNPLIGLSLIGAVMLTAAFFDATVLPLLVALMGLSAVMAALARAVDLEESWTQAGTDYAPEIQQEMVIFAAVAAGVLMISAYTLPAIDYRALWESLRNQPLIAEAEEALGLHGNGSGDEVVAVSPGRAGGSGVLPRGFLISGNPAEGEDVMMRASISAEGQDAAELYRGHTWRGMSYETYTGRGWTLGREQVDPLAPGEPIPQLRMQAAQTVVQTVLWEADDRVLRYTFGMPRSLDQEVQAHSLSGNDLIRVRSTGPSSYSAESRISVAPPGQIRTVTVYAMPEPILNRYTQLPDKLPERVVDLANEVTISAETPYDEAVALERFLRQYPYSLDVGAPPPDQDLVDTFLFDFQSGYCDYYASSMVVMARALGIPARIATGFTAQEPDAVGIQTIRRKNGHSWPELYFGDYGWIAFEPTAGFATPHANAATTDALAQLYAAPYLNDATPPDNALALPDRAPAAPLIPWVRLAQLGAMVALVGLLVWLRQRRRAQQIGIDKAYAALQEQAAKLGQSVSASETPSEFRDAFLARVAAFPSRQSKPAPVEQIKDPVSDLTSLYNAHRYGNQAVEPDSAETLWQQLRRPLWRLRLSYFWQKRRNRGSD